MFVVPQFNVSVLDVKALHLFVFYESLYTLVYSSCVVNKKITHMQVGIECETSHIEEYLHMSIHYWSIPERTIARVVGLTMYT